MSAAEKSDHMDGGLATDPPVLDDPVFVLTCARSGSTLLRMILDAHPELACPPETNIAKICAQLWEMWITLDPECTKSTLSERAQASIRSTADSAFENYLASSGKKRLCEKSLGTAEVADKILEVYEKAKFICLYRHAMDVVNSGIEASPWGLHGYGFSQYIRPGLNTVSTLVSYWMESTEKALEFEAAHGDRCLRVYYEELVADPEQVAAELFDFIGVAPAPGITKNALLNQERPETFGFGDHKIRSSNQISDRSVGRGIRVPPTLIPPNQAAGLNQILARLGYIEVTRAWQTAIFPPQLLVPRTKSKSGSTVTPQADTATGEISTEVAEPRPELANDHPLVVRFDLLDAELTGRIARTLKNLPAALDRWNAVGIVAYSAGSPMVGQAWRVDCAAKELESDQDLDFRSLNVDWLITGEIEVWMSVLGGAENVSAALRNGYIRQVWKDMYGDGLAEEPRGEADLRLRMVTHLLELGTDGPA